MRIDEANQQTASWLHHPEIHERPRVPSTISGRHLASDIPSGFAKRRGISHDMDELCDHLRRHANQIARGRESRQHIRRPDARRAPSILPRRGSPYRVHESSSAFQHLAEQVIALVNGFSTAPTLWAGMSSMLWDRVSSLDASPLSGASTITSCPSCKQPSLTTTTPFCTRPCRTMSHLLHILEPGLRHSGQPPTARHCRLQRRRRICRPLPTTWLAPFSTSESMRRWLHTTVFACPVHSIGAQIGAWR